MKNDSVWPLYIKRKLTYAAIIAVLADIFIVFTIGISASLFLTFINKGEDSSTIPEGYRYITWLIRDILGCSVITYLAGVLLITSPWQATLGMKLNGLQVEAHDGERPAPSQALKFLLLSPVFLPLIILSIYSWSAEAPINLYLYMNALILIMGSQALLIILYTAIWGGVIEARQCTSGLVTKLTPEKLAKLETKVTLKRASLQYWLPRLRGVDRGVAIILLGAFLYLPVLSITDHLRKPIVDYSLYNPYEVDWGNENAYFALVGLTAPSDVSNFYEFGRTLAFRDFTQMESIKKRVGILPLFNVPQVSSFENYAFNKEKLQFQRLDKANQQGMSFDCITAINYQGSFEKCLNPNDVPVLIDRNKQLWTRFNAIPNYKNYSVPPEVPDTIILDKYLARGFGRGDIFDQNLRNFNGVDEYKTLIDLAELKVAQIVLLQENGDSEAAFNEWSRFMLLYSKMIESKTGVENKAISIILFGMHASALETLLYHDPTLVKNHFDEIKSVLSIANIEKYRSSSLLADNYVALEPILLYETGRSKVIQNKIYECLDEQGKLASMSAKEYFGQIDHSSLCAFFGANVISNIVSDWSFGTPDNLWANIVWGLTFAGELKAVDIIENMHIQVAEMRMVRLGAEILNQNIPLDQIEDFVRGAPVELQNPLNEAPFKWDKEGSCLWFEKPGEEESRRKFYINLQR